MLVVITWIYVREPEFMERMKAKYHEKAMENGALVVSPCGFDSVHADFFFGRKHSKSSKQSHRNHSQCTSQSL